MMKKSLARARAIAHRWLAFGLCAGFACWLPACSGASDIDPPQNMPHQANAGLDWRDQVIYQIMIDRFEDGDRANDFGVAAS